MSEFDKQQNTVLTPAAEGTQTPSPKAYSGGLDDLHDLFASTPLNAEEEDPLAALRNDPNYAALIRDLEYIAKQARLLFAPAEEAPSDEVWKKIESQLGTKNSDA